MCNDCNWMFSGSIDMPHVYLNIHTKCCLLLNFEWHWDPMFFDLQTDPWIRFRMPFPTDEQNCLEWIASDWFLRDTWVVLPKIQCALKKMLQILKKFPPITGDCTCETYQTLRETLLVDLFFPVPMYRSPKQTAFSWWLLIRNSWVVLVTAWSKFCFREGLFQLSASSNLCFQQMMIPYVIALLELKSNGGILAEIQQF